VDALVGPARVLDEGVAGGVEPLDEIDALYRAIGGTAEFHPHVTFAYARAESEMEELEVNASDAVYISALSLVDVRRENEVYSWEVVDRVTLGA
jgi:2'-5' RNA ligase